MPSGGTKIAFRTTCFEIQDWISLPALFGVFYLLV